MTEWPIRVTLGEVNDENGTVTLNVAYGEEFRAWFMKREGLKKWSEKRFQKVVGPILSEYYAKQVEAADEASQAPSSPEDVG